MKPDPVSERQLLDGEHPMAEIATKLGPEGVGMVAGLMDANRRDAEWVEQALLGSTERERDEWKERALEAEQQLFDIRRRIDSLIFGEAVIDA